MIYHTVVITTALNGLTDVGLMILLSPFLVVGQKFGQQSYQQMETSNPKQAKNAFTYGLNR